MVNISALNRTIQELKLRSPKLMTFFASFKSNHIGIETLQKIDLKEKSEALNRTIQELKPANSKIDEIRDGFFKSNHIGIETVDVLFLLFYLSVFKSNHIGIETIEQAFHLVFREPLNRTIQELKLLNHLTVYNNPRIFKSNHIGIETHIVQPFLCQRFPLNRTIQELKRHNMQNVLQIQNFKSNHIGIETQRNCAVKRV